MARIAVIDTETTGIDPATDRVVEYAQAVVERVEGDAAFSFGPSWRCGELASSLCDPKRDVPPEAKAVHHLTEEMLAGKPTVEEFLLDERPDLFVGVTHLCFHNAEFDLAFLSEVAPSLPIIDTWRACAHLYPKAPSHKNQVLRYWLNAQPPHLSSEHLAPHRAGYDVLTTAGILIHLIKALGGGDEAIAQLVRLSDPKVPILQWIVRKTKYRGTAWSEMDAGFCRWVIKASPPFDPDFLHTARYQLQWLLLPELLRSGKTWGDAIVPGTIEKTVL